MAKFKVSQALADKLERIDTLKATRLFWDSLGVENSLFKEINELWLESSEFNRKTQVLMYLVATKNFEVIQEHKYHVIQTAVVEGRIGHFYLVGYHERFTTNKELGTRYSLDEAESIKEQFNALPIRIHIQKVED